MEINNSAVQLRELGKDLKQENDATGFLGVTLERDPETGLLEMKQTGLIKQDIKALGLAKGMLLYLSGHTLPDITFAGNCCA
jgi:hypothetical protein